MRCSWEIARAAAKRGAGPELRELAIGTPFPPVPTGLLPNEERLGREVECGNCCDLDRVIGPEEEADEPLGFSGTLAAEEATVPSVAGGRFEGSAVTTGASCIVVSLGSS